MSMMENYFVNSLLIDWEQIGPRQKASAAHSLMKGSSVEQDVFSIMNEIKWYILLFEEIQELGQVMTKAKSSWWS